jgi:hypothetical protein
MNLEEKDFGFYTCEASNKLGGDSELMLLYGMILFFLTTIYFYSKCLLNYYFKSPSTMC